MILTVTLNAAIDKLYLVDRFEIGMVTRVKTCCATAGGKGLNVSRVVSLLGEQVAATGFAGGHSGRFLEEMLKKDGIRDEFVPVPGESRTCVNIMDSSGKSTELLEPGPPVGDKDQQEFLKKFELLLRQCSAAVISGSLPAGCAPEIYEKLITLAKNCGRPVLLDTSGEALKAGIRAKPTLVKPNTDEIGALSGVDAGDREQVVRAARRLSLSGIPYAVVSMGKNGAVMACGEDVFEGIPPEVKVVNTVGCGDAMIGAFAVAMTRGYPAEKVLQFALEVSSANAMCRRTGFFRPEDLRRISGTAVVRRLM